MCDAEGECHYTGSPFTTPDSTDDWDSLTPSMVRNGTRDTPTLKFVGNKGPCVIVGVAHTGSWAFIREYGVPTRDFAQASRYDTSAVWEQTKSLGHYLHLVICSENRVPARYRGTVENKIPMHNPNVTITAKGEPVLIWSGSRQSWWGPDSRGYVTDPRHAGKYTLSDAIIRTRHAGPGSTIRIEDMPGESAPPDDRPSMPNPNVMIIARTTGPCVIWSGEHQAWWRADGVGYTSDVHQAGQWTLKEAIKTTRGLGIEKKIRIQDFPTETHNKTQVVTYVTVDQFDEEHKKLQLVFVAMSNLIYRQKDLMDAQAKIIANHEKLLRDYVAHRHFLDQPRLRALLQDAEGTDPIKTGPGS